MADSSGSVFLFEGIKRGLCRIADYSTILQQPPFLTQFLFLYIQYLYIFQGIFTLHLDHTAV